MKIIYRNKEFLLRHYIPGDVLSLQKNINDRQIGRSMSHVPYPYTINDAKTFIDKTIKGYKDKKNKNVRIAIDINNDVVGAFGATIKEHAATIGYWVGRDHRGTGLSRRAAREFIRLLFKEKKIVRIEAHTYLDNKKSQQLLLDLGFKREGLLRKFVKKNNRYRDVYVFSLLKNDK